MRRENKTRRYLACHQRAVADGVETPEHRNEWMRRHAGEFGIVTVAEVFGLTKQRAHKIVRGEQ